MLFVSPSVSVYDCQSDVFIKPFWSGRHMLCQPKQAGGINIRKNIWAKVPEMRYCSVFSCDDFKTIWFDFVSVKSLRRPSVTHSLADQRAQVAVVSQKLNALEIVVSQKVSL